MTSNASMASAKGRQAMPVTMRCFLVVFSSILYIFNAANTGAVYCVPTNAVSYGGLPCYWKA